MRVIALLALRNLRQARRRTLLLGGIVFGASFFLALVGALFAGVSERLETVARSFGTGDVAINGYFKSKRDQAFFLISDLPKLEKAVRDVVPEVDYFKDRFRLTVSFVSDTAVVRAWWVVGAREDDIPELQSIVQLVEETTPDGKTKLAGDLRELATPGKVALFEMQARKLNVGVGDVLTARAFTHRGIVNIVDVEVAAIMRDMGEMSEYYALVSNETMRTLFDAPPKTASALHVHLKSPQATAGVIDRLDSALRDGGYRVGRASQVALEANRLRTSLEPWMGQKLELASWQDEVWWLMWRIDTARVIYSALFTLLAIVVAVGMANAMIFALREREREIGTLRALGMSVSGVTALFVTEGAVLALGGASLGALIGAIVAAGLNHLGIVVNWATYRAGTFSDQLLFFVAPSTLVVNVLILGAVVALASIVPAARAARIHPSTAMRGGSL